MRNSITALLLAACTCLALPDQAEARGRFRVRFTWHARIAAVPNCAAGVCPVAQGEPGTAQDALAAVNAQRAARGLPPYQLDPALQAAAQACASYRATYRIHGHCANDFVFLPAGARAESSGIGTMPAGTGFAACCVFQRWTYAGAATVRGADGMEYHQIFVRR